MKSSKDAWLRRSRIGSAREGASEEPWLISYADMMTLLVGLFVMMFSFATFDQASVQRMKKALEKSFGAPALEGQVTKLTKDIKSAMALTPYMRDMELKPLENGLEVSLITTAMFESGSAELTADAEKAIRALVGRIREFGPAARVRVEGYADDNPIARGPYSSNWVLSAARSATIVEIFERLHFPADRLETVGYGSARPLLPNRSLAGVAIPENQAKNRRVVIKIILRDAS